jgi:hypothetical protein
MKPAVVFPHDREGITQAIRAGASVDSRTGFARACSEVAGLIVNREPAAQKSARRFLEFFSLAGVGR